MANEQETKKGPKRPPVRRPSEDKNAVVRKPNEDRAKPK